MTNRLPPSACDLPHYSPNFNPHAERLIQTLQNECVERFIVMGCCHLDHITSEYLEHYNTERPHSGIGHRVPDWEGRPLRLLGQVGEVKCRIRLGGVHRSYERVAGVMSWPWIAQIQDLRNICTGRG